MIGRNGERNKDYRWRCRDCRHFFTVRTATVFEETRLPLRVWVYAIWKACSSKKGISALQLAREMEITHKSALFILRRIRHRLGEALPAPAGAYRGTGSSHLDTDRQRVPNTTQKYKVIGERLTGGCGNWQPLPLRQ
jgi:hypothetical protein